MEFYTIGVYNTTEREFFSKLVKNRIDTFCDIRQRRGVRGSKYAFVNSIRLQQRLAELDVKYGHFLDLAPTQEVRDLQKAADIQKGELKRERLELGNVFVQEYQNRILANFDFETFMDRLDQSGANRIVLFCVEELAEACHRSIVAKRLTERYNYKVTHL